MRSRRWRAELNDEALIAAMAAGDPEASLVFVRRHQGRVYGIALAITRHRESAEDVAQRTFERAWRHAAVFDSRRGSVPAWLASITRNLAIDSLRVRRPAPLDPADLSYFMSGVMAAEDAGPEEAAVATSDSDALVSALRGLPVDQARAVVMGALYGMPYAEVAAVEGIPVNTVKTRVRTGMRRLRDALVEEPA